MRQPKKTASPRGKRRLADALFELRVVVAGSRGEEVGALLMESGAGGVVEETIGRQVRLVTYGDRPALERLAESVAVALGSRARSEVRPLPASLDGWDTAWMDALRPVTVSKSLILAPTNAPLPESGSASVVRLEPALAFGFGEHPTTRLAAREVERLCRKGGVRTVLDVGTGSGVLSVVAAVAGARRVVGIDVDARAVHAAKRNAALNGVGSVARFSATPIFRLRARFDLVVANVDRGTLLTHATSLRRRLEPQGTLILTGFLGSDVAELVHAFAALGLHRVGTKREADWALLTLRSARPTATESASRQLQGRLPKTRRTIRTPRSR